MKKYSELQLVQEKGLRDDFISKTEVLDKVGDLLLLPNTECATTEQVAEYYNVGLEAVGSLIKDNRDEVESDGYKVLIGSELKSLKDLCHIKYQTGKNDKERWSIDRENMKKCIVNKCPHFSWGTCLKPTCILFPKKRDLKVVK